MRKLFGKQQDWAKIRANTEQPIITIITSTFKVKDSLHWTYGSIKKQTYPYIQWIVVDGASTDGTIELLHQYSDMIDIWFSEPDTGIYDAWNKSLDYIQGDWVQFLGAGDELFESDTIEKVAKHLQGIYPEYKLVSSDIWLINNNREYIKTLTGYWNINNLKYSLLFPIFPPHPGVFHHKSIFLNKKFDDSFRIISDGLFLLINTDLKFKYIALTTDKMLANGISNGNKGVIHSYEEMHRASKKYELQQSLYIKIKSWFKISLRKIKGNICDK